MEIRALRESDNRSTVQSGDANLDQFLSLYAGQNDFRLHVGTTYLAVADSRVAGYATVAPGHVEIEDLPESWRKRLPRYPLPVLRLARLATDSSYRGRGLGGELLRFVLTLALRIADDFGCIGVAVKFHEQFGFAPLDVLEGESRTTPRATPMFLPIREIQSASKKK